MYEEKKKDLAKGRILVICESLETVCGQLKMIASHSTLQARVFFDQKLRRTL